MTPTSGRRVTRIGLTGGIGSGKSTVAKALVALGATLVDTDAIALRGQLYSEMAKQLA